MITEGSRSFLGEKLELHFRGRITRYLCLFVYFLFMVIFSLGLTAKIFVFKKSAEWAGNFVCCSNSPVKCVDMFRKHKFCFITKESRTCKSHLSQSTAGTSLSSIPECGLFYEFVSHEISHRSDKLIIFLDLSLDSQNSRIDSQALRLDSWKFRDSRIELWESRREWLSTYMYFWVVPYVTHLSCLFHLIIA